MEIPHTVLAAGWVPFSVVLLLILIFSFAYTRYYQAKYDSELCSTVAAVLGLAVALMTCALVPVDIFIVSFMKDENGKFKEWAKDNATRIALENSVQYGYYALYLLVVLFMFFILPFSYFFFEECDDQTSMKQKICTAIKYSLVFMIFAAVMVFIGAFVPFKTMDSRNGTDWQELKNLFREFGNDHGKNAVSFTGSILALVGMLLVIVYTAYGMSAWPMDLVKGRRSVNREMLEIEQERDQTTEQLQALRDKYSDGRRMSSRDRDQLEDLEEEDRLIKRRLQHLDAMSRSCVAKCTRLLRPCEVIVGVIYFLLAILVFTSLLITNIDKIMHSGGTRVGYALPHRRLPNPLDIIFVYAQKVFPLDYILVGMLVMYFVLCSMGGIRHIGIWFCCIRMYKIRPRKTKPQGLLFLCFFLMFIVMGINVMLYQLAPQYIMYGSQHYMGVKDNSTHKSLLPCSLTAPSDQCIMTRMASLLTRFFYKFWFFGAAYFWMSWVFLALYLIGFIVSAVRKRRSSIEGQVDSDDFDSDEELLSA